MLAHFGSSLNGQVATEHLLYYFEEGQGDGNLI